VQQLRQTARAQFQPEAALQDRAGLAKRNAELFVEQRRPGDGTRPELHAGGPLGVRDLQRVRAVHFAALLADPLPRGQPRDDWPHRRQLFDVLGKRCAVVDLAAAARAGWQRHVHFLIDVRRTRSLHSTMSRRASGPLLLRDLQRFAPPKWRCLASRRPLQLFNLLLRLLQFLLELANPVLQLELLRHQPSVDFGQLLFLAPQALHHFRLIRRISHKSQHSC
jgi:hypothetical protein